MYRGFNIKCKDHAINNNYYQIGSEIQNAKKKRNKEEI